MWIHKNILTAILRTHPAVLVVASFCTAILAGTLLLLLPIATRAGSIPVIDALFTATSATCVTGLVVVDTGTCFTAFGQGVILALIQIGGLGVMTISVALFRLVGKSISFRQRMVLQDVFTHTPREDILKLLKSIVLFTLLAEAVGAVFLFSSWNNLFPWPKALYFSVFHSVSAFCNAGFSLFPDSLMRFSDNLTVNFAICVLIVIGGLGFPVLYDIVTHFTAGKGNRHRLSIQTKTVLWTTFILIAAGAILFAFLERHDLMMRGSSLHCICISVFQSVTCRTAGFNTIDIGHLNDATLAVMIFLMFFGASPGSCGGGIKTTTLAIIFAFTYSRMTRKRRVNLFKKSIPNETVTRSTSLILVSFGIIGLVVFMILMGNTGVNPSLSAGHESFLTCLFETVSAFGTVGLSMGVTPLLNLWGKSWIILMMIVGRVGVLTFAYIIVGSGATGGIEYSEENIMIG